MSYNKEQDRLNKCVFLQLLLCFAALNIVHAFPQGDDFRYIDKDYANPGTHQLASWLASELRSKEYISPIEVPLLPYGLPLQEKRNSEVTNAIIGSEETQKMYRDGRK